MSTEILTKTLWDQRRFLAGWAVGLGAASLLYTGSFVLFDVSQLGNVAEAIPAELVEAFGWQNFTTPSGYLGSTVFGLVVPILCVVFAIGVGARHIAGDEEEGVLELTMTHPVSRTSLVLQKAAALAVECIAMGLVVFLVVGLLLGPLDIAVSVSSVLGAVVQLVLLAIVMGTLALATGAFIGRRGLVIGVAAGVMVFAFFADTIVQQVEGLAWIENLSFFHYYGGAAVLDQGFIIGNTLILLGSAVVLTGLAVFGFGRRDVGT